MEQAAPYSFHPRHWIALGIAAVLCALSLVLNWSPGYIDFGDGNYLYIGWRIALGDVVYREILAPQPPCHLYLGAAVYKFAQLLGQEAHALYFFRFASLLLRMTAGWLVVDLARRAWGGAWAGVAAGALYLWLPIGYWWSMGWQSEPLEIVFLLAMMRCALAGSRRGDVWAGIFAALAALTNATAAPFLLALIGYMAWRAPRRALRMLPSCVLLAGAVVGCLQISTQGAFLDNVVFNQTGTFPTGPVSPTYQDVENPAALLSKLKDPAVGAALALDQHMPAQERERLAAWSPGQPDDALLPAALGALNRYVHAAQAPAGASRDKKAAAVVAQRRKLDAALDGAVRPYAPARFFLNYAAGKIAGQGAKILKLVAFLILPALLGFFLFRRRSPLPSPERGAFFVFCLATSLSIFYVTKGGTMDYIFSLSEPALAIMAAGAIMWLFEQASLRKQWRLALGAVALLWIASLYRVPVFYAALWNESMYECPAPGAQTIVRICELPSASDGPILAPPFYAFMARRPLWGHYSELFIWHMNYRNDIDAGDASGAGVMKARAMAQALRAQAIPLAIIEMGQTGSIPEVLAALEQSYSPLFPKPIRTLNATLGFFATRKSLISGPSAGERWNSFFNAQAIPWFEFWPPQ